MEDAKKKLGSSQPFLLVGPLTKKSNLIEVHLGFCEIV